MTANWWGISAQIVAWIGVAAIALAIIAPWIRQRIERRRRCPKCWYDMSHAPPPGMTCSECGYTAKRERKLYKARKRWKLAFLGAVMLLGAYALNVTPAVRDRGWVAGVPTAVIVFVMPWLQGPDVPDFPPLAGARAYGVVDRVCLDVLDHRIRTGQMPAWQFRWLILRASSTTTSRWQLGVNRGSPPRDLDLSGWFLERALYRYDPSIFDTYGTVLDSLLNELAPGMILTRDVWIAGAPMRIQVNPPRFFSSRDRTVVVKSDPTDLEFASTLQPHHLLGMAPIPWRESTFEVNPVMERDEALFHLEARTRTATRATLVRKRVTFVRCPHEIIAQVQSETIATALRDGVQVQAPRTAGDLVAVVLQIDPSVLALPQLAVGLVFEVCDGDEVVLRAEAWHGRTEQGSLSNALVQLDGDPARVANREDTDHSWTLRIRGDPAIALRNFSADRYWSGEIVLPLEEVWVSNGKSPFPGLADVLTPPSRSHPDTRPESR